MSAITKLKTLAGKAPMVRTVYDVVVRRRFGLRGTYQHEFVEFVAQRRGVGPERARELVVNAQKQFLGGWSGEA